jgi:single-strand DNA-binding protein
MSQDNQITLRGYLTAEPRYHQTKQTGTPVTEIRIGSTPRRLDRETGEWVDQPTSYYTVRCWRRLAINAVGSLHKGDMVVVRGKFSMRTWTDSQERPRSVLEIEADSLGHDLAHGWTHYMRGARQQTAGRPADDAGELARQGQEPAGMVDGDTEFDGDEWGESAGTVSITESSLGTGGTGGTGEHGGTGQGGGTGELGGEGGEGDDVVGHADGDENPNLVGVSDESGEPADGLTELALAGSR